MRLSRYQDGFTLVEIMVTVGIISILAAVAIPAYNGYLETTAAGTTRTNAEILAGFEDTYFYENDTYLPGTYDPPGTDDLTAALDWLPSGDEDQFRYVVVAGSTGDISTSYQITVTYKVNPTISATVSRP